MRCGPGALRQVRKRAPRSVREARHDPGDRGVELGVGQRPLVVAQRQPVGQALVGLGQRLATVDVEERDVAQQRPAVPADGGLDRGGRRLDRDDDRQVTFDRGEACRRRDAVVGEVPAGEAGDRDLRDVDPLGTQVEGRDRLGMELAEPADEVAAGLDPGSPAGMEVRVVGDRREGRWREAEPAADQREHALRIVEVVGARRSIPGGRLRRAGQREAESPPLVGRRVARGAVALADLEDRDVVAALAQVGRDDLEQAADQALAQDRVLARQRVRDDDRAAGGALLGFGRQLAVVVGREPLDEPGRDQGGGHDLGQAGAGEGLADGVAHLERIVAVGRHGRVRQGGRDEVVAADADDLFRDVGLDRQVAPPAGDGRIDHLGIAGLDVHRVRRPRRCGPGSLGRPAPSRSRPGRGAPAARRSRSPCRAAG